MIKNIIDLLCSIRLDSLYLLTIIKRSPGMKSRQFLLSILIIGIFFNDIKASEDTEDSKVVLKIGNFSIRGSQQPGPLVGFGQHVIDKEEIQFYVFADAFTGKHNYKTDITSSLIYGITDRFSITAAIPVAPKNKRGPNSSSGIQDILLQLESAFYLKYEKTSVTQATIVGNITFPTGSIKKNPPTGSGSFTNLIGLTFNYTTIDWFYFGATGIILPYKHKGFKIGNQYLYQCGIGRNIGTPPGWIYAAMVELIGEYSWKDTINSQKNPNSGSNLITIVPSLWISSEKLILQFGLGYPIAQHLFGSQLKQQFSYYFNFGWTF